MPMMMQISKAEAGPVVVCDQCGDRIKDATMANYYWSREATKEGDRTPVFFVHKKPCTREFETARGAQTWPSMELRVFPVYLIHNIGIDEDEWNRSKQSAENLASLG
jgi:hypothetical protein